MIISDININKAVLHVLNNDGSNAILANKELILDESVYKFIYKITEKLCKDKNIKFAKFNNGNGIIKSISKKYFKDEKTLVDVSKDIANDLYEIMRSNNTIPSCDLLVCEITSNLGRILGIIKLDYIPCVEHVINSNKIEIRNTKSLPLTGQKIQKAAFIINGNEEYESIVIDKIKPKATDEYDAKYFTTNFLDSYFVDTSIDNTKNLINETNEWINTNIDDDMEALKMKGILKEELSEKSSINVADFADTLVGNDFEKADILREALVEKLNTEDELSLDPNCVDDMISNKLKLKIDSEIDITIPQKIFEDSSRVEIVKNGDGTTNIILKFIKEISEK